jgi:hypothetical protein
MDKNTQTKEQYFQSAHRFGRKGGAIALVIMLSMPIIAGLYFNAMPTFLQIVMASVGLLAIFVPVAVSEVISYTPVLGSSIYLTLVTGNVTNLKVPVANNALKLMDVQYGSEDADVISAIAVGISTFFTVLILILGVVLMVPLKPVLTLPAVKTATQYILPSLFGSMALGVFSDNIGGGIRAPGRMKGAIAPALIVAAIVLLDRYVLKTGLITSLQGILILLMLPVTYFGSKLLYEKGKIQVIMPGDNKEKQ